MFSSSGIAVLALCSPLSFSLGQQGVSGSRHKVCLLFRKRKKRGEEVPATAAPFIGKKKLFQQLLSILLSQNDIKWAGMGPNSPARIVFKKYIYTKMNPINAMKYQ